MLATARVFSAMIIAAIVIAPVWSRHAFAPFCHQDAERSWSLFGEQLPVCVRCLGFYIGAAATCWLGAQFSKNRLIATVALLVAGLGFEAVASGVSSEIVRFATAAAIGYSIVPLLWTDNRRGVACYARQATLSLLLLAVVPLSAAEHPGLLATYTDSNQTVRVEVPNARFFLDPAESLHPAISSKFEATWRGELAVLRNGEYTFDAGGAELLIDGRAGGSEPLALTAGAIAIELRYRRPPGEAQLQLRWKGPAFDWEPVPNRLLSHSESMTDDERLIDRGRALVNELGCVNCHAAESTSLEPRRAPDLDGIGSRRNEEWLFSWMADPRAVRDDAAMPVMLGAADRKDIARYLTTLDGHSGPALDSKLPSRYQEYGATLFQTRGCVACHHRDGVSISGAGSKMPFGELVAYLKDPSFHDPGGRMPALSLNQEEAVSIAAHLLEIYSDDHTAMVLGDGDASRGRSLVASSGCLSCHSRDLDSDFEQPMPFAKLGPGDGCLAEQVSGRAPRFALTPEDRAALNKFLETYAAHPDVSPAPIFDHAGRLERLRCNACHEWNGIAPTAPIAETAPPLTGVGEKLTSNWLRKVLTGGPRSFEATELRMPDYHPREAARLVEGFAKSAGLKPGNGPSLEVTSSIEIGHAMMGTNFDKGGMACNGCHGWGQFEPMGEHGPQLLTAGERLRYDWFVRWMRDPARVLSGTSMPNYFGSLPTDEAAAKINNLWAALRVAKPDNAPEGYEIAEAQLGSEEMPVPTDKPIVVRWDMPGTSPASISVGLPGGLSYCFDAGAVKLLYAWEGGFVDMSTTLWTKKNKETNRTETARYVGDVFYRSEGFPLRVGELGRVPQARFKGYRLIDGLPRFHYLVDGVHVYETIVASDGKLIRRFEFPSVKQPMWFVEGGQNRKISTGSDRKLEIEVGP